MGNILYIPVRSVTLTLFLLLPKVIFCLFLLATVTTSPPFFLSHLSSLLETPTCVSCLGPSVFSPPQPGELAYSHNIGHQEINYMRQARVSLKRKAYCRYCSPRKDLRSPPQYSHLILLITWPCNSLYTYYVPM